MDLVRLEIEAQGDVVVARADVREALRDAINSRPPSHRTLSSEMPMHRPMLG